MILAAILPLLLLQATNCQQPKSKNSTRVYLTFSENLPPSDAHLDPETGAFYECPCVFDPEQSKEKPFSCQTNLESCCRVYVHLSNTDSLGKILERFSRIEHLVLDSPIYSQVPDIFPLDSAQFVAHVKTLIISGPFNISSDFFKNFTKLEDLQIQRGTLRKGHGFIQNEKLTRLRFTAGGDFDKILGNISSLRELHFEGQYDLKKFLGKFKNLNFLYFKIFDEAAINADAFKKMKNLKELHLRATSLQVKKGAFKSLQKLNHLTLSNVTQLVGDELEGLTHLRSLRIDPHCVQTLRGDKLKKYVPEIKSITVDGLVDSRSVERLKKEVAGLKLINFMGYRIF